MEYKERFYPESKYGGFTDVDSTVNFYFRVNSQLSNFSTVLDIGCGRGQYVDDPVDIRRNLQILKGKCKKVIGIDVDENAKDNPCIDEFRPIDGQDIWPIEDETIDLCLSDWSLEHIENPDLFFRECSRVLKPGGYLFVRTSNLFHYRTLFDMLIPNKYHDVILRAAQRGSWRKESDVFPTVYKCNTKYKIKRLLAKHNFSNAVVYGYQAEPAYLSFSRFTYALGKLYQSLAPRTFAVALFAFATKISISPYSQDAN
jgi:SAM-dependent methyltransferase